MLALNALTVVHLFIFFLILFFRRHNSLPNKILALILIDPAINFVSNINILLGNMGVFPFLYFFAQATSYLFAPLVYYYVCLLTGKRVKLYNPLYLLTGCFICMTLGFSVEFFLMDTSQQLHYMESVLNGPYPYQMDITNGFFIVMQQVYFTVAAFRVFHYRKRLSFAYSSYRKTRVKYTTGFIGLIWLLNALSISAYILLPTILVEYIVLPVVLVIIYSFLVYYAFKHHSIFTEETFHDFERHIKVLNELKKPENTKKPVEPIDKSLVKKIEKAILEDKVYLNMGVTIKDFAEYLGEPAHKITWVLNQHFGDNFNQFINKKRIIEARRLIDDNTDFTMEQLAYEVGFNSRASFYRAFQKYVNTTPTEYLKNNTEIIS